MRKLLVILMSVALGESPLHARFELSHIRWVAYPTFQCEANWDENCEDVQVITAPDGYQICKFFFKEVTRDGWDAWFTHEPTSFYTNDHQDPDRFRAVRIAVHAFGNGNPFDQRGSKMVVQEVGVDLITAAAENEDRYAEGCEMPKHN